MRTRGEKNNIQKNGEDKIDYFIPFTKINPRWIHNLNRKAKFQNFNKNWNYHFEEGNDFLRHKHCDHFFKS